MLYRWTEIASSDLKTREGIGLWCVGSCEQHSDYLPLGTDSIIGEHLAEIAAKNTACSVYLLPTQNIGFSPHHQFAPGCLTLAQRTMQEYLVQICESAFQSGLSKLVILNAHGGNQPVLQTVVNDLGATYHREVILVRYWDLLADVIDSIRDSEFGGMGHAGELETSLMLYFRPDFVQQDRIDDRPLALGNEWHHPDMFAKNSIYVYKSFDEFSKKGNVGQPQHGSREKGEILATYICKQLAKLLEYYASDVGV